MGVREGMVDKVMKFRYIVDAAHGWLEVPITLVDQIGFAPTSYSYKNAGTAYLEEDGDATGFLKACEEKGIAYEIGPNKYHEYWHGRDRYDRF